MRLLDVNILVYAHREDAPQHKGILPWLEGLVNSEESFAISDLVLSGFLRVVTHPKIFDPPSTPAEALAFVEELRSRPNFVSLAPGVRHWEIFVKLCTNSRAKGNLIPDAFHAALAIESGSEWVSTDGDFKQFEGLRWKHPLDTER